MRLQGNATSDEKLAVAYHQGVAWETKKLQGADGAWQCKHSSGVRCPEVGEVGAAQRRHGMAGDRRQHRLHRQWHDKDTFRPGGV